MLPFSYFTTSATRFVIAMPIPAVKDVNDQRNGNCSNIHVEAPCLLNRVPAACWVTGNYHAWSVSSDQGVEVLNWPWVSHSSEAETSYLPLEKWRGTRNTVHHNASSCYVYLLSAIPNRYCLETGQPQIQEFSWMFWTYLSLQRIYGKKFF